ncbi:MAG TPA: TMEM165/GDT1 family protein [Symbiobacteriaceae bacterium]|nr:TMEM165/GDT1 family protein [Symbiobacteriaceae bacterium]
MAAIFSALFMVFAAEMGDKTQLIAMAFAARYRTSQVLWGVLIGSLLNHGIAVMVGSYLGEIIPMHLVGIGAAVLFLVFGVLALRPEQEGAGEEEKPRFGPVATVAMTFFLGEMGDKTQLTTLAMAVEYRLPLLVLTGAVLGMMAANAPAVLLGDWLCQKVAPRTIRMCSAAVFVIFGLVSLYESMGPGVTRMLVLAAAVAGVAAGAWYLMRRPAGSGAGAERRVA